MFLDVIGWYPTEIPILFFVSCICLIFVFFNRNRKFKRIPKENKKERHKVVVQAIIVWIGIILCFLLSIYFFFAKSAFWYKKSMGRCRNAKY